MQEAMQKGGGTRSAQRTRDLTIQKDCWPLQIGYGHTARGGGLIKGWGLLYVPLKALL